MTEEQLRERGYYLFGVNQDEFVQVRDLKTDHILVMGYGSEQDALERAGKMLAQRDGYNAHKDGHTRQENPHEPLTTEHEHWETGFTKAEQDTLRELRKRKEKRA